MKIFTPLPGEYVASALKRGNELLGINSLKLEDFLIKPIPREGFGFSFGHKAEFRDYAKFEFPPFFIEQNISEEILNKHTLYPLTAALGRSRSNTIVTPTRWKKICTDCVFEDFDTHGTAYIHRRNVQFSVRLCSVHGSELIDICPTCSVSIAKHDITKFGLCSRKYKKPIYQPNSANRLYSKFIAELLNYNGITLKRHIVDGLVQGSLMVKYRNAYIQEENLIEIIRRELGIRAKSASYQTLSDDTFAILAFLACESAEKYLDLITNKKSIDFLSTEINSLRSYQVQRYTPIN
ncbi:hypothetical protein [Pseudomonas sp. ACM7]|uniref:hypothetical protein n=1 Tax=Pseudomonas sp. ACM7 TaxID=2052956 RepID=UPI001011886B|nr:hypothetical protein [Pseudomonas sp. ACM7]